jgi:hypothetical protein
MPNSERRRELREQYDQTSPEAGVYVVRNTKTGKVLLGTSTNLASVRGKMDFAHTTGSASVLHLKLKADSQRYGVDAFELEVLEVLDVKPEATPEQVRADLDALEELWRERFDPATLY